MMFKRITFCLICCVWLTSAEAQILLDCEVKKKCGLGDSCVGQFDDFKLISLNDNSAAIEYQNQLFELIVAVPDRQFSAQLRDSVWFLYFGSDNHFVWTEISMERNIRDLARPFHLEVGSSVVLYRTGQCR